MDFSSASAVKGVEIHWAASSKKHVPQDKSKRVPVLAEQSADSSPLSGVSEGSKDRPTRGGDPRSVEATGHDVAGPAGMPGSKRHCSSAAKCSLSAAGGTKAKSTSSTPCKDVSTVSVKAESEITSVTSLGPGQGPVDDSVTDNVDPCELVSWPDSALDFSLDTLDAGEVDHLEASGVAAPLNMGVPSRKDQTSSSEQQDSQSESARPEATDCSDRTGTEGNSSNSKGSKSNPGRRKVKVDWTPELHRRFVQAVEQLGVEKAIPSRILELMGVKCLTRHNIASHLQKYRSHRRHLAAREAEAANWQQQRKASDPPLWPVAKGVGPFAWPFPPPPHAAAAAAGAVSFATAAIPVPPSRPVVGVPHPHGAAMVHGIPQGVPAPHGQAGHMSLHHMQHPLTAAPGVPVMGMPMHVWGHPSVDHSQAHMWQRPGSVYPMPPPGAWYGPDGSVWHYPGFPGSAPPVVDMWGGAGLASGMPGMVAGTPCAPANPMGPTSGGMAQRLPQGGVICGAPVHGAGPGNGMPMAVLAAPFAQFPHPALPAAGVAPTAQSAAPAMSQSGAATPATISSAGASTAAEGDESSSADALMAASDSMAFDSFLDEDVMRDQLYAVPDDLSFVSLPGGINDSLADFQATGVLDAAISAALANPSTPLPLGLKPPSMDGVLEELNRQGITMPPQHGKLHAAASPVTADDGPSCPADEGAGVVEDIPAPEAICEGELQLLMDA